MKRPGRRTTRYIYIVHKWTGLLSGINLLILSLTAAWLLGERAAVGERGAGALRADAVLIDESRRLPMQPIVDKLLARLPGHDIAVREVSRAVVEGEPNGMGFLWEGHGGFGFQMDPYSGVLAPDYGEPPPELFETGASDGLVFVDRPPQEEVREFSAVGEWMLDLHAELFLGATGTLIVGGIGVLMLLSTVTGLYIYGPFMKALAFGAIRGTRIRFALSDAHKFIGMSTLMFNLVIALTGIGVTLGFVAIRYHLVREFRQFESSLGDIQLADPLPGIEDVVAAAQSVLSGAHIYYISYPGGIQGGKSCMAYARPEAREAPLVSHYALVTAEAVPRPMYFDTPLWIKATLYSEPLHYGNFGGRPMRLVYLVLGLTSGLLSVSGYVIWAGKVRTRYRARTGRTAPIAGAPSLAGTTRAEENP